MIRLELIIFSVSGRCVNQFCYISILSRLSDSNWRVIQSLLTRQVQSTTMRRRLIFTLQAYKDSNPDQRFWRPLFYHWTIDLFLCPRRESNSYLHELKARCYDQYTHTKAFRFVPPLGLEPRNPKEVIYSHPQLPLCDDGVFAACSGFEPLMDFSGWLTVNCTRPLCEHAIFKFVPSTGVEPVTAGWKPAVLTYRELTGHGLI